MGRSLGEEAPQGPKGNSSCLVQQYRPVDELEAHAGCIRCFEDKQIIYRRSDRFKQTQIRWLRKRTRLRCLATSTKDKRKFLSSNTVFILFLTYLLVLVPQTQSSDYINNNNLNINKNSGQFFVSQLCQSKSLFPTTKRVEGAVLSSVADTDVNCTIIFRTKSAQQHFVIRFEELRLGCDDHLKMFDGDLDYGQPSIKDFSCRDSLASVPIIKTTGTYLTMRYSTDSKTKPNDGFRMVVTAVFDVPLWDCPNDYTFCHNRLCIAKSLICDDVNHCLDNSDEMSCSSRSVIGGGFGGGKQFGDSIFSGELNLWNALALLVVLVLVIFTCVIIFIVAIYCRRESNCAQYQHHLQRTIGVPMQTSQSLMFTNPQNQPQYVMIARLAGPPPAMQSGPTMETGLFMPSNTIGTVPRGISGYTQAERITGR